MLLRHFLVCGILAVSLASARAAESKSDVPAPRTPAKSPADALKALVVRPGFRVELAAGEPLVQSPVACDFDENGRLFVVELPEYNAYAATRPHGHGRVVLLEDTDGDGLFDQRTVFVDNLDYPTGVICWDGGVYVGAAPDLLYCKDTKRDGKADIRTVVLTGFGKDKAGEGQLNSFRWTLDNRILISTGLDGGDIAHPDRKDIKPVSVRSLNVLLDPRTNNFQVTSGGGQHGMSQDDWGRTFVSGNSDPIHQIMYDARYLANNAQVQAPPAAVNILPSGKFTKLHRISEAEPWRVLRTTLRKTGAIPGSDEGGTPSGFFTGASGVTIYRGDAFPNEYRGNVFVGEVANNLVFRATLKPNGVGLLAERADADREFLASKDVSFRPVQFANAPDGCLCVIDMARELIEGAAFLAPQVLKVVDPSAGIEKGRIWRIVPDGFQRPKLPRLGQTSTAELVALLESPNGWHRDTASRLLYQRQSPEAEEPLKRLAHASKSPLGRAHAMAALDGIQRLEAGLLIAAFRDTSPEVRRTALRLWGSREVKREQREAFWELRRDSDPAVRQQLAFSLGQIPFGPDRQVPAVYIQLALRDSADPWARFAILAGLRSADRPLLLADLAKSRDFRRTDHGRALIEGLADLIGADSTGETALPALDIISALATPDPALARAIWRALMTRASEVSRQVLEQKNVAQTVRALTDRILADAVVTARDARKPADARATAIRDLQLTTFAAVSVVLAECLKATQPPEVQLAALETLGRFGEDIVPSMILAAWPAMSPRVRATATETLLSRGAWVQDFLDAVEAKTIARSDIDPARITLLKKSPIRTVATRTAKLFTAIAGDRQKIFEQYRKALELTGDAAKGKLAFKTHCSVCHALEGVGVEVGADLKAIRDHGMEAVLLNILDPNREVKPQYLTYAVELKTGRLVTGMISAETATGLTLRRPDGQTEAVQRSDIDTLCSTGLSYMPDGLEKLIDIPAMADLLAYLNSIK